MRLRRRPMLVIWGGRPSIDVWVNSDEDRRRQAMLKRAAELARIINANAAAFRRIGLSMSEALRRSRSAMRAFGEAAAVVAERQAAMGKAIRRAQDHRDR